MAGLLPAGVGDGSTHQHPANRVKEWQATGGSLRSHDSDHLVYPLWLAAFVRPPGVHLGGLRPAAACRRRLNAESLEQARELGAGSCGWPV